MVVNGLVANKPSRALSILSIVIESTQISLCVKVSDSPQFMSQGSSEADDDDEFHVKPAAS